MARKKRPTTAEQDAADIVTTLAFRVDTARPGDVVFISPARPLPERAMQHLNARFKAANLGVKVVVLQHGHTITIESPPADPLPVVQMERLSKTSAEMARILTEENQG